MGEFAQRIERQSSDTQARMALLKAQREAAPPPAPAPKRAPAMRSEDVHFHDTDAPTHVVTLDVVGKTALEIRTMLHDLLSQGKAVRCPTCDKHCHVDARKITDLMARELVALVRSGVGVDMYRQDIECAGGADRSGMYSKLRFWGLIEAGKELGYWHATQLGADFVRGKVDIPARVYLYNNVLVGIKQDERITFRDCVDASFVYADVFETESDLSKAGIVVDTAHTRG